MQFGFLAGTLLTGLQLIAANTAYGQGYPAKPIRVFTAPVGTSAEFVARVTAQGISGPLGQPVVVENRAPVVSGETVAKAPPDGYTLYITGGNFWIGPLMQAMPYDPVRDFAPISILTRQPNLLVVHPSMPVKSVRDLIALAKAKPGQLNYAAGGLGGASHLAAEVFKAMAGVNITLVNYKLPATALTDLLTGQVQVYFVPASTVTPHVKSGRLRALGITSAAPSVLFPEMPTVAASGVPGYDVVGIYGVFAPAKTPAAIITRLNQEIVQSLNRADVKDKFLSAGLEILGSTPDELAAKMKSEMTVMGKVFKDAGISAK